jgi:hypothetical protein
MIKVNRFIVLFSFIVLLSGCRSKPVVNVNKDNSANQQKSNVSSVNPNELKNSKYDLTALNVVLPQNWHLNTSDKVQYNFVDEKGENRGWIISSKYEDDFDFKNVKPNHSSIINDEYIDIPLATCRLFTLDADNGTAASGITGTHNDYYAIIIIKEKIIYKLEFSKNDKKSQTKEQFIEILKSLSFK